MEGSSEGGGFFSKVTSRLMTAVNVVQEKVQEVRDAAPSLPPGINPFGTSDEPMQDAAAMPPGNMQQTSAMQQPGGMQQSSAMQPAQGIKPQTAGMQQSSNMQSAMQQPCGMQQPGGTQRIGGMQQTGGMQPPGGMQQIGGMQQPGSMKPAGMHSMGMAQSGAGSMQPSAGYQQQYGVQHQQYGVQPAQQGHQSDHMMAGQAPMPPGQAPMQPGQAPMQPGQQRPSAGQNHWNNTNFMGQFHDSLKKRSLDSVDFLKIWLHYDTDKSGYLEAYELDQFLLDLLRDSGQTLPPSRLEEYRKEILAQVDTNNDGKIELAEFARILPLENNFLNQVGDNTGQLNQHQFEQIFVHYDKDRSNQIAGEELLAFLRDLLARSGHNIGVQELYQYRDRALHAFDKNRDHALTREELALIFAIDMA